MTDDRPTTTDAIKYLRRECLDPSGVATVSAQTLALALAEFDAARASWRELAQLHRHLDALGVSANDRDGTPLQAQSRVALELARVESVRLDVEEKAMRVEAENARLTRRSAALEAALRAVYDSTIITVRLWNAPGKKYLSCIICGAYNETGDFHHAPGCPVLAAQRVLERGA